MHSAWLKGYKDKEKRKQEVLGAAWAFRLLRDVLEDEFRKKPLERSRFGSAQ